MDAMRLWKVSLSPLSPSPLLSSPLSPFPLRLNGCYEALEGGNTAEALVDFTGGISEPICLDRDGFVEDLDKRKQLYQNLTKAHSRGALISCSIRPMQGEALESRLGCGLVKGHAYGVTDVRKVRLGTGLLSLFRTSRLYMIRMRNPWGTTEWSGAWSDESQQWQQINMVVCRRINTTLLSFHKSWLEAKLLGEWRRGETELSNRSGGCINNRASFLQNPQFMFDVERESDTALICLQQEDKRALRSEGGGENLAIGFEVFRVRGGREGEGTGREKGHAYGVTDVRKVRLGTGLLSLFRTSRLYMIRMRNPWGTTEWSGAWSDESVLSVYPSLCLSISPFLSVCLSVQYNSQYVSLLVCVCLSRLTGHVSVLMCLSPSSGHSSGSRSVRARERRWESQSETMGKAARRVEERRDRAEQPQRGLHQQQSQLPAEPTGEERARGRGEERGGVAMREGREKEMLLNWSPVLCSGSQFMFDVERESDTALICLQQEDKRALRSEGGGENLAIGFEVFRVEVNRECRLHMIPPKAASSVYMDSRSVFLRAELTQGRYVIVTTTFAPGAQVCVHSLTLCCAGSLYRNDCPVQPYIPIYLIVSGVFVLVLDLVSCVPQGQEGEEGATVCRNLINTWNSLASLFLFIWFITGSLYRNDCPVQPYIPIYLIVSGVFVLVLDLVCCVPQGQEGEEGATVCRNLINTCNSLASLFLFIWFITGNVWIYSIYEPSYDPGNLETKYCNKTLYLFAFWSTTVVYIIVGVMLLGGCCLMLCMCALGGISTRSEDV
ncbi:UNVERIFIED_CONTAM: hypothetical protein FKN15_016008 [Acipenser sinensis]